MEKDGSGEYVGVKYGKDYCISGRSGLFTVLYPSDPESAKCVANGYLGNAVVVKSVDSGEVFPMPIELLVEPESLSVNRFVKDDSSVSYGDDEGDEDEEGDDGGEGEEDNDQGDGDDQGGDGDNSELVIHPWSGDPYRRRGHSGGVKNPIPSFSKMDEFRKSVEKVMDMDGDDE